MHKWTVLLTLASCAWALPQATDLDAILGRKVRSAAGVTSKPLAKKHAYFKKRQGGECAPLPLGSGPVPTPDTAAAFLNYTAFSETAFHAPIPAGYVEIFSNLQASSNANGYLGYTTLTAYDTVACANACDSVDGCEAFNIYFERDPTLTPAANCSNPPSTTVIKCVFWGGPVTPENTQNTGQVLEDFRVVMAGSNGYVNRSIATPPGFNVATYYENAAISAPLDCYGTDTYIGYKIFNSSLPFDAQLCAAACDAQNDYNTHHYPNGTRPVLCNFFNTYLVNLNGTSQGQVCAMYTSTWPDSFATNTGQYRGSDHYTISHSYSFSSFLNPNPACLP